MLTRVEIIERQIEIKRQAILLLKEEIAERNLQILRLKIELCRLKSILKNQNDQTTR